MEGTSRYLKAAVQGVFYIAILALLAGRSSAATLSHDEIQFIAPGQLLAQEGLLPYLDFPFVHIPYAVPFYALSAWATEYDYLAARMMSTLAWMGCILLMVAIARDLRHGKTTTGWQIVTWKELLWEFALVFAFVNHAPAVFLLRAALNHSFATLFALLSLWSLARSLRRPETAVRGAFLSGAAVAAAGLARLNFASLALVIFFCSVIFGLWFRYGRTDRLLLSYTAGGLVAGLPAFALAILAPGPFYYGNFVYIRLNTLYYEQLLHRAGMSLASKFGIFAGGILSSPLEVGLYLALIAGLALSIARIRRRQDPLEIARLGAAGMAIALWLSAFAPTPGLLHYFAAPVPFIFVLLGSFEYRLRHLDSAAHTLAAVAVVAIALVSDGFQGTRRAFAAWENPASWPPIQAHQLGDVLRGHVEGGRMLTLHSALALEAGYDVYPFTAIGPFSWRTSLLLTAERRREYGVTSPEELTQLLEQQPPDAILVGFEAPNAGFERRDQGGLEKPFSEYALEHGYSAVELTPELWPRGLTLWIRP